MPIALYGSEVWGIGKQHRDSDPFEHLQYKFIKEILGIHCKASNAACLAELNRLPLYTKIEFSAIKYWLHILESNNSLALKIYKATEKNNSWIINKKNLISRLGFHFINLNPIDIKMYLKHIQERINDIAFQKQETDINQNKKMNFFNILYIPNKRPSYVDQCKSKSDRSTLCKLRLSAHTLSIERGRYLKIPRQNRVCLCCNNGDIEDELHFLLKCSSYKYVRDNLIKKLNNVLLNNKFSSLSYNLLISILNSNSQTILKIVVNYLNECLLVRNSLLKGT